MRLRGAYTKNGAEAVQPLPPDLVRALTDYLADKPADQPVWLGTWAEDAAEMLRVDLAAAGIPCRDDEDLVADFHGLRHSFITLLASSGIHPKMAQALARHSTITLTMDRDSHVTLADQVQALAALPPLLPGIQADPVHAGAAMKGSAPGSHRDQTAAVSCGLVGTNDETGSGPLCDDDCAKPLSLQAVEDVCGGEMTEEESASRRT